MPINNPVTPASIGAVPTTREVIAGTNMTGGGALGANVTLDADAAGIPDAPSDGTGYVRKDAAWAAELAPGIADAPNNGTLYGRKSAAWFAVPAPGISDAPSNGTAYVRKDAGWIAEQAAGIADAPNNGTAYVRKNAGWVAEAAAPVAWDFVPPLAASLATNFGTVPPTKTDDANIGLIIDGGAPVNGDAQRIAAKAIPAPGADWEVTVLLRPSIISPNYSGAGLFLVDNAAGKCIAFGRYSDGLFAIQRRSIPTGWTSTPFVSGNYGGLASPVWVRVSHVGTNNIFSVSADGKNFVIMLTEADTAFLPNKADFIGLGVSYSRNTGSNTYVSCPYWAQSW